METEIIRENSVYVGFSPNDFFYNTVSQDVVDLCDGAANFPQNIKTQCNTLHENVISGNNAATIDTATAEMCYQYEICKNKSYADALHNLQNKHSGSDERYQDIKSKYHLEVAKMVNYCVGIILASGVIMYIR